MPIDWIAAALLWVGNIILIRKKHWSAFSVFGVANCIWLFYWISKEEWAAAILVATFIVQNVWGMWSWYREAKMKG